MSIRYHDGHEREIPDHPWKRVGLVALILVILATAGWEMVWRAKGYEPHPVDTYGFWAIQRRAVSAQGDPMVIIGSSRVMFDINLDVWEEETGDRPIQLALEGTSPVEFLEDLAADTAFSGTVIVGVTPGLFFTGGGFRRDALDHYRKETPSERVGQRLGMVLEQRLAFIENINLPLFTLLRRIPLPGREGVDRLAHPLELEIHKLSVSETDRAMRMWHRAAEDSAYRKLTQDVWSHFLANLPPPPPDAPPPSPVPVADEVREYIQAIRDRGGDVVFVRSPSTGPWREVESKAFPREAFWDVLADTLDAGSVHFEDNPGLQGYELPEWSHLRAEDAELFTRELVPLVREAFATRRPVKTLTEADSVEVTR